MDRKPFHLALTVILSLTCFALTADSLSAAVKWRNSLRAVSEESKRTGKPMLLKFTAEWCTYCHKMEKSFDQRDVSKLVNDNFIPIKVDADEKKELVKELEIAGFPTTVIISPEFKVMQKITGFKGPEELEELLTVIIPPAPAGRVIVQQEPKPQPPTQTASVSGENPIQQVASQWAFEQICLVELVENGRLAEGNPAFQQVYRGRQICFSSSAAKNAFDQNPEKYWPALNGVCPVELSMNKQRVDGSPQLGAVYRGKLWLFSTQEARLEFASGPQKYLLPGIVEEE